MATQFTQPGNSGRFAVRLQVGIWSHPTIGRSAALDMTQPFGFQPLKRAGLSRFIAPAAFRIAREIDTTAAPTYAVVSSKSGIQCLYVRSTTADGLRQTVAGLLAFGASTGYLFRIIDITKPGEVAIAGSSVIQSRLSPRP